MEPDQHERGQARRIPRKAEGLCNSGKPGEIENPYDLTEPPEGVRHYPRLT